MPQLPFGEYLVTFHRPGCRDHNESITVQRGSRVNVTTAYQDGSLELSSDPSGAAVSKDGSFLGTTPLVLHDLTPKVASFELNLPGYDPTPVSVEIPEGQTLKYEAQVLRKDRIFTLKELKNPPVRTEGGSPQLSAEQKDNNAAIAAGIAVTYGLAEVSFRFVETPFLRLKERFHE